MYEFYCDRPNFQQQQRKASDFFRTKFYGQGRDRGFRVVFFFFVSKQRVFFFAGYMPEMRFFFVPLDARLRVTVPGAWFGQALALKGTAELPSATPTSR